MFNTATRAKVTKKCMLLSKFINEYIFEMNKTDSISKQNLIDNLEIILLYVDEINDTVNS